MVKRNLHGFFSPRKSRFAMGWKATQGCLLHFVAVLAGRVLFRFSEKGSEILSSSSLPCYLRLGGPRRLVLKAERGEAIPIRADLLLGDPFAN